MGFNEGEAMKRLVAEVLAEMLAGYGVTHVFMVPAVVRRTFVEMEQRRHGEAPCGMRPIRTARSPWSRRMS
jgi:hypothetical protein